MNIRDTVMVMVMVMVRVRVMVRVMVRVRVRVRVVVRVTSQRASLPDNPSARGGHFSGFRLRKTQSRPGYIGPGNIGPRGT